MGNPTKQDNRVVCKARQLALFTSLIMLVQGNALAQDLPGGSWQSTPSDQRSKTQFNLQGSINPSQAFISQIAWVDNDRFLSLALLPEGAEVWRTSFEFPRPERFMSHEFLTQHICPVEYLHSLTLQVSPGKNFIFFAWEGQGGVLAQALVDISQAPKFRLKRFSPPLGMQVSFASFSPDDTQLILGHDPYRQDCGFSLLAINLTSGLEDWRIESHSLNFVNKLWWSHPAAGPRRLFASAGVYAGNFSERTGYFSINPETGVVTPESGRSGIILGAEALWGTAWCVATKPGTEFPYSLNAQIPGTAVQLQVPLSSQIRHMRLLADPGRVLISNTLDGVIYQLWLVDLTTGDKFRVDKDCAEFVLSTGDTLLVRGSKSNQLRVYQLELPGTAPSTPVFYDTGESVGVVAAP